MQITTEVTVVVPEAKGFQDLFDFAETLANVEGKDLYRHVAKMNVAAGDLAACVTERTPRFPTEDAVFDEVAALVLRSVIFGLAHGMTEDDMGEALSRETSRLVRRGLVSRIEDELDVAGIQTNLLVESESRDTGFYHYR